MNIRKISATLLSTVFIVTSCAPRTEAENESHAYDTETDCLNGTMIVSVDGKYGLADTSGREILAPEYDDVYYISDEIAVAFTGQNVGFFDQNGRRLGETVMEGEASVDDLLAAYSKIEKMRREQWNSILNSYEELRKYCQSDSASVVTANIMADDIRAALQKVGGPMEKTRKSDLKQNIRHTDVRTMRKLLITILITLLCVPVFAQSAASIRKNNSYIYTEATAATSTAADSVALDALVGKLAQTVDLPYSSEIRKSLINTYLEDIKRVCAMISSNGRGKASVMRYIQRNDVERIFEGRRSKVKEMLSIASTADRKCQMDVALRYYSWAETLMRSLPSTDVVAIAEAKSRRETILKGLNVEFDRQDIYDKGIVELTFTFKGKPVKNIDYKFFDGKTWSKVLSAKDGKGFVEVRPGSKIDQYRIKYEITPAHLQHLFREVSLVEKALAPEAENTDGGTRSAKTHSGPAVTATASESSARKIDFSAVKKKVLDVVAREEFQTEPDSTRGGLTPIVFSSEYEDIVNKVCKGVTSGADESLYEYFTPEGYEIFNRLIRYGNARVLNFGELNFYGLGEEVYARSVPMVFSFRGNQRQFVENIVFTFNGERKICDLSFSLGKKQCKALSARQAGPRRQG